MELEQLIEFLRAEIGAQLHSLRRHAGARRSPTRRRRATPPAGGPPRRVDGVLLIDKPAGITSHDVVAAVRRSLGGVKTGHAGTLDPFATGLLVVLLGRATKSSSAFMGLPKRYETVAQLGAPSSTGDPEGEITRTGRVPPDPPVLPVGEVRQRPPRYSAVKIGGERAYRRARRGEEFEMPERIVTVHGFASCGARATTRRRHGGYVIECSLGHLRALADRRPGRRLLPGAAAHGDRAFSVRGRLRRRRRGASSRGAAAR